jgi:GxxExxY protein
MNENKIASEVLNAAFAVHSALGPWLFETVYEAVLAYELTRRGLAARRQVPVPITHEGMQFEEGFRADLIAGDGVIVELKSVEKLAPVHAKQLLTQLRLSGHRLGLLINFGEEHLKDGIRRVVNGLVD